MPSFPTRTRVRYELGDRPVERDGGQGGYPFRAVRSVVGRSTGRLRFDLPAGASVLFATALNDVEVAGLANGQLVGAGQSSLTVRMGPDSRADATAVREPSRTAVESILTDQDLAAVDVEVRQASIEPGPLTGKSPLVVAAEKGRATSEDGPPTGPDA